MEITDVNERSIEIERSEYLEGVLWADEDFRLDKLVDASKIDPFGTGTKAFWRGFIETAGTISMKAAGGGDRAYPRVHLKAVYQILVKFLAFMQEEICTRNGIPWEWDELGRFEFQAKGTFLTVTGQKAVDIVTTLYLGQTVGRSSVRHVVDRIVVWIPKQLPRR